MPTFTSIGLHPDLQHRIVAESTAALSTNNISTTTQTATTTSTANTVSNKNDRNNHSIYHTISTPMALLNRNPKQQLFLRDNRTLMSSATTDATTTCSNVRPISQSHVQQLRYEVSVACIQQSMTFQQQQQQPFEHFLLNRNDTNNCKRKRTDHDPTIQDTADVSDVQKSDLKSAIMSTGTFTGMVSAHDIIQAEIVRRSSTTQYQSFLPTGCHDLDQILLTLLSKYIAIPTHHHIPHLDCNSGGGGGGVPLGWITQISGPPASGKTQFVLSIIASVLLATATAAAPTNDVHCVYYICNSQTNIVRATQRLFEILSASSSSSHDRIAMLKQILFPSAATSTYQVLHRLLEVESYLLHHRKKVKQEKQHIPIMLIIDSCSGSCTDSSNDGSHNALLLMVGHMIRRLTRQYHITTVLINGIVSNIPFNNFDDVKTIDGRTNVHTIGNSIDSISSSKNRRSTKPALGYRWNETIPDICLWFQHCSSINKMTDPKASEQQIGITNQQQRRRAAATTIQVTIDRYPSCKKGEIIPSIYFNIDKKGIKNIGV